VRHLLFSTDLRAAVLTLGFLSIAGGCELGRKGRALTGVMLILAWGMAAELFGYFVMLSAVPL